MAGAAPTAKPAPFLRPLDIIDRGVLLAESALSTVIVLIMVFVAVGEALARPLHITHPALRAAGDVMLHGTVWAAFLGASFATRGRRHLAIDVLGRLLPDRGRRVVVAIAATLGAVIAYALARGIFVSLTHAAADATEQLENLRRAGATSGTVDRSYEFQFVIPGGFVLISVRLLLHAFHEFIAALAGAEEPAPKRSPAAAEPGPNHSPGAASAPYREGDGDKNTVDMVEPNAGPPVARATLAEVLIAFGALAVLVFLAAGSTVTGPALVGVLLAGASLGVPLALRYKKTGSFAPTEAPEQEPGAQMNPVHIGVAIAAIGAIIYAARVAFLNITHIPVAYGVTFFVLMAIMGAPLFTFLGGMAIFLWSHGSIDVPAQDLANSVEDALGPHFARMSVLPTIPIFTLAGYLMSESKTPQRMVRLARAILGPVPGGLAIVCVVASAFFTVFSGASGITIVAIGGLLLPALLKNRYPENFSLGLVTTGGAIGITFPPCLPLIVYGIVAGLQETPPGVERLELMKFLRAGLLPGLLLILLLVLYAMFVGIRSKVPRTESNMREAIDALKDAKWEIALPFLLGAGLFTGALNPTQMAAFTAVYVLIIEVFIYKDLSITRDLPRIIPESMILVGAIFVKLCAATVLTAYFIQAQTADALFEKLTCGPPAQAYLAAHAENLGTCREAVDALAALHQSAGGIIDSKLSFLIALNVFLLVVGMLMDIFSAIVVVVPLIAGIALHFNVNPYHLGIVFLLNLEIGYLMPPMGLNLFIAAFRFNRPVPDLYKMVMPFIGIFVVVLMVTTYVPWLTLVMVPGQLEAQRAAATAAATTATTSPPATPAAPTTPTAPTAVQDSGTTVAAGDASAGAAEECGDAPREGESFADFDRRCNITGTQPTPPAAHPAAPTPPPAAPSDCGDTPREGESFADFDRRCNITGTAAPPADAR